MTILSRLHKLLIASQGALHAPAGFVKDVVSAAFGDDEFDGFADTLAGVAKNRSARAMEHTIGPSGVLGASIGALPETGFRSVPRAIGHGLEFAYREGISEPLTTLITAGSLAKSPEGGFETLFDPETWREGYRVAQNRSPAQAAALLFATGDITDEEEVLHTMESNWFPVVTGLGDLALRFYVDPAVLGGKAFTAARRARVSLATGAQVSRYASSSQLARLNDEIGKVVAQHGEGASAVIRDRWFSDKANYGQSGGVISHLLASASDGAERMQTLRAMVGDPGGLAALRARRVDLSNQVERLMKPPLGHELPDGLVQAELERLYPLQERMARVEAATEIPTIVERVKVNEGRVRTSITRSDFWQQSSLARPVRVFTERVPHRMIALHDGSGDIQVRRYLQRSALDVENQDLWRARYLAATTESERAVVLAKMEQAAVQSLAESRGLTVSDVNILMEGARPNREATAAMLKSRAYDAKGRGTIRVPGEDGAEDLLIPLPLWATQQVNFHALVDLEDVRSAIGPLGDFKLRHGTLAGAPDYLLTGFYRAWKPMQLLRFGWPIRVLVDEQLRILAKVGAVSHLTSLRRTVPGDVADTLRLFSERHPRLTFRDPVGRPSPRVVRHGFTTRQGHEMEGAFGAAGDAQNAYRQRVSSAGTWRALHGAEEDRLLGGMRQSAENWGTVMPTDPGHAAAWEWAVNQQIGQDALGKVFLKGATPEEAVRWMQTTDEGRAYVKTIPERAKDLRAWAETNYSQVHDYLPTEELRQLALKRTATAADLARAFPDAALRPAVHGEILMQTQGKGLISRTLDKVVTNLYNALGRTPTDILSRNPFFDSMYRAEAQRLVDVLDDGSLTTERLAKISDRAREYALDQTKAYLYDLAERSRAAEMLRFVTPFYAAWEEVLTTWAGLAVENPAFIRRMHLLWQAPDKAGIVTDENGRPVEWGKTYAEGERGSERYVTIPVPSWVKDIPGMKGVGSQGSVAFNRKSFNIALQGMPGFGPPVQYPVNEIVKDRPDLEDSVKFILPFGAQRTRDLFLPSWGRRALQAAAGEEDRVFHNMVMRIYFDAMVDFNLGKREDEPTYPEALGKAKNLARLRIFAAFALPAQPSFRSPYQLYIDAFRQARERYNEDELALAGPDGDERTPEEWFLDTYGPEYFPLTESLSKSVDGIPPTVEAWRARRKHLDLIQRHPEYGGLIVGAEGAGAFSGAVYASQFETETAPGSGQTQRRGKSWEEAAAGPNVRLGWIQYGRLMDSIDAQMHQRGLPNLNVKGAADLRAARQAVMAQMAVIYPEWYEDFQETDAGKWAKRIAAFEDIVADPQIGQRAEMVGLKQYLDLRRAVLDQLLTRKAQTLDATSNSDLRYAFESVVNELTERTPAFGALYHRWLANDPVALTLVEKTQRKAS